MYTIGAMRARVGVRFSLGLFQKFSFSDASEFLPKRKVKANDLSICIAGGAGKVGSKLAMLLKSSKLVDCLTLHDIDDTTYDVATDLRHISTRCKIYEYRKSDSLAEALMGCQIVVICASGQRQENMTTEEMFRLNAPMVEEIAVACTEHVPKAIVLVVTQPLDSLTPLVAQVYRDKNLKSHKQVIGVTVADTMRAGRILAQALNCSCEDIVVPVIGGHSHDTIVPIYSACTPIAKQYMCAMEKELCNKMLAPYQNPTPDDEMKVVISNMVYMVKHWDAWVHGNIATDHSVTMTGSMAAYLTVTKLIQAMSTKTLVSHMAYVETKAIPGMDFSSVPLLLGWDGVRETFPVPVVTEAEKEMLAKAVPCLELAVQMGREYAVKALMNRCMGFRRNF